MISKENLNYALKNLYNRKVRSSLTILSIFVGIVTIFIFISFGWGLYFYINELSVELGVDKIFVQAAGIGAPGTDSNFVLGEEDLNVMKRTRGVLEAIGMTLGSAQIKSENKLVYNYMAGLPTKKKDELEFAMEFMTVDLMEGKQLEYGKNRDVVLGYSYSLPNKIFAKPLSLGQKIEINGYDFKIIGFFEEIGNPSDDANLYITIDAFNEITGTEETNYGFLIARIDSVDNLDEIKERLKKKLRKSRGLEEGKEDFFIASFDEYIEAFGSAINIVVGFILLIAFISVLVSAINTANTMFTSILERTKEIGVLKAIGAKNSEILIIFLLESSILGFIAGVLGVFVGWIISNIGGAVLASLGWSFLQPYFPSSLFIGCILFATIVGTISGVIPAYNASKKNPVDSLRYE